MIVITAKHPVSVLYPVFLVYPYIILKRINNKFVDIHISFELLGDFFFASSIVNILLTTILLMANTIKFFFNNTLARFISENP